MTVVGCEVTWVPSSAAVSSVNFTLHHLLAELRTLQPKKEIEKKYVKGEVVNDAPLDV
jgi:hypothetical protein